MIQFTDKIVYDYSLCQQCGACFKACLKGAIRLQDRTDGTKEVIVDNEACVRCKKCVSVCPSNRNLIKDDYFDFIKGRDFYFACNSDEQVRKASSSGGACRTLIVEGLKSGAVDGVFTLKKLEGYPHAEGCFFSKDNIPTYGDISNSVYHSVMACLNVDKVEKCKRLMIVGTSCQLYALEKLLKGKYEELIKVCIFCKQQKTLGSTRFLAKLMGTNVADGDFKVSYRGDGWPGNVKINSSAISYDCAAVYPFGRRLWTVPGCNICGDPYGIESGADICLMDPWGIRKPNDFGETLMTVISTEGAELIAHIPNLNLEKAAYDDVKKSLGFADVSRKRLLVDWWKGNKVSPIVARAGESEKKQRLRFEYWLEKLPKMPWLFYRVLNKLVAKKRDKILTESVINNLCK